MGTELAAWLEVAAIALGVFFMFVSSLGVLRLADFYQRVHAPTKAATLGLIFLLLAVALNVREKSVVTKSLLAVLFIGVTAPVGGHLLTRAAYRRGVRPATPVPDEYAGAPVRRTPDAPPPADLDGAPVAGPAEHTRR